MSGGCGERAPVIRPRLLRAVAAALVCALASAGAAESGDAASEVLLTIRTASVVPRSNAPFPLVLTVTSRERTLRQGRLRLQLINEGYTQIIWTSDEWVVGREGRTATVLLPPLSARAMGDGFEVKPAWLEDGRELDLGRRALSAADRGGRNLLLGLCLPPTSVRGQNVQQSVMIERYAPRLREYRGTGDPEVAPGAATAGGESGLHTVPVRLRAEELPEQALAWCAYDAVLLAGETLVAVKPRQVQALETWVRAGGSLLVLPDGPVAPAVAELLRRSATAAGRPGLFASDERGQVDLGGAADGYACFHVGLGRLAVAPLAAADREDTTGDRGWRAVVCALWKLRADQFMLYANTGELSEPDKPRWQSSKSPQYRFLTDSVNVRGQLIELLWPDQVAVIPFSVILAIFLVFVLAVGPGDWFLLGWLKARRFTWLLFPALAIACTWFTVWISRRYLGVDDLARRLEIVDVDGAGATLRHDRIELDFTGASQVLSADGKESLWASLGAGQTSQRRYRQATGFPSDEGDGDAAIRFTGAFPAAYQVKRYIAQWTPTLSRELSFAAAALPWTPDFSGITDLAQLRAHGDDLRRQAGAGSVVVAYQAGRQALMLGDPADLYDRRLRVETQLQQRALNEAQPWLQALCIRPREGWYALASQISPQGGTSLEDCAIVDSDDGQSLLVVVAQRRGDAVWMVRRMLRGGDQQRSEDGRR